jgi:predicted Zn-dependent protease with MMP-like domain
MIEEPGEEGLLGLFVGEPVGMAGQSAEAMPPQIFIFTENIWEEAGRKPRRFLKEVGTTYLHELGHGLGWDEADLRLRDLD